MMREGCKESGSSFPREDQLEFSLGLRQPGRAAVRSLQYESCEDGEVRVNGILYRIDSGRMHDSLYFAVYSANGRERVA